jgi:hypothetical protein
MKKIDGKRKQQQLLAIDPEQLKKVQGGHGSHDRGRIRHIDQTGGGKQ